ncbi:hypothetical protein [Acuticoccus kandeliae]|uniref:hypothetical protein n=1 Tax=Acuticoccus kandeliae TaxID=2073160 RepID=UPI000D3EA119|nr:hypothetical protein [Acuticoccus kandeliae]
MVAVGLVAVSLVGSRWLDRPMAQLDLFTHGPVAVPSLDGEDVRAAVKDVVARLGEDRVAAMVRPVAGAAVAGTAPEMQVLRTVEVKSLAPDRIRIRVGVSDIAAGHEVADGIRGAFIAGGLKERILLQSESTGGRAVLVAQFLALIGVGLFVARGALLLVGRARTAA